MSDHSKLKQLAEGCRDEVIRSHGWTGMIEDADLLRRDKQFLKECSPEAVLALIDENEHARMRIKELDLLFGRYLLGMRASVIEWQHGKGADAAMQWIWNGLAGPGELPPEDETQAQFYFDREIVAVEAGMEEVAVFFDIRRAAKQVTP